jgi:arsenate reductase
VAALQRTGFKIDSPGGENPHYQVAFAETQSLLVCYSKTFDDVVNPKSGFAAIMTCSDADENCPFIPGAAFRLPLTYDDPKVADGTPEETARYDERVRQIGREILYAMQLAAQ